MHRRQVTIRYDKSVKQKTHRYQKSEPNTITIWNRKSSSLPTHHELVRPPCAGIKEAEDVALNGAGANNRTTAIQHVRVPGYGTCYGTVVHSAAVLNFQKDFPDRRMCVLDWARMLDKCPTESLVDPCSGVATFDWMCFEKAKVCVRSY